MEYGFHCTDFHKIWNCLMALHASLVHKIVTKSGKYVKKTWVEFSLFPKHIMTFTALIFMNSQWLNDMTGDLY